MTPDLNERWLHGLSPFDGLTVSPLQEDLVLLPILRKALRGILDRLCEEYSGRSVYRAEDWHEHDGHLSAARPLSWSELESWLASDGTLYAAGHEDTDVRTAVFPDGQQCYLRLCIPRDHDNPYPERRGSFDVTCGPELARDLAGIARESGGFVVTVTPAKEYFDRSYGG
jgi:hypothetical protein